MLKNLEKYQESIKKSIRAIAHAPDLNISFSSEIENAVFENKHVTLPQITSPKQLELIKGLADSAAFRLKFDVNSYTLNPHTKHKKCLTHLITARCEILGMEQYPGTKKNILTKLLETQKINDDYTQFLYVGLHYYLNNFDIDLFPKTKLLIEQHREHFEQLKLTLRDAKGFISAAESLVSILPIKEDEEKAQVEIIDSETLIEPVSQPPESIPTEEKSPFNLKNPTLIEGSQINHTSFLDNMILDYKIFTTEFDQEMPAEKLESIEKLKILRDQLSLKTAGIHKEFEQQARKFKQKLMARRFCKWEKMHEDGVIDSTKLAGLISNQKLNNVFKKFKQDNLNDTIITLLIDNSGSMRGNNIATASILADLLSKTLDSLRISMEVLGFTTLDWKGGKSFQKWLGAGSPKDPGRLNGTLHIIYKKGFDSWRKSARNFGLMLKESMLKENIDGEALKWAAERILKRPEKRKILIVISDGAPLDEVTIANNSPGYLSSHLINTIKRIERMPLELIAIGIGHKVEKFYKNSISIKNHNHLGEVLFSKLDQVMSKFYT
ncbi:cobalt chelatase large subunit [endosymbiont of Acanthamoeba sp. UWC8]|uniref:cobaltochelatase CobT-related protein n=1 Tax=endosymbiont of Acanthamoeba sp. UWC8 TaxID=86106 RepID=UPI0004D1BF76|nr:hypothetical protein [endosymbiont of Acanthamoeba sp. UWC8]AIF81124.1 cobalt chelatase large subunit [endosymbiont of Acanthamoeba sp. UWC8]